MPPVSPHPHLQALADLGLQGAFDAVYGSSAGAINSTFFLAGAPGTAGRWQGLWLLQLRAEA